MCTWGTTKIATIWSSYSIILPAFWSTSGTSGMMMYLSSSSGVPYCSAGVQSRSRSTMLARFTSWCKMARFIDGAGVVLKMASCYVRCWCTAFLMETGHVDCWWELQRLVVTGALSEDWDTSGAGRARTWPFWRGEGANRAHTSPAQCAEAEMASCSGSWMAWRCLHVRDLGQRGDGFSWISAELCAPAMEVGWRQLFLDGGSTYSYFTLPAGRWRLRTRQHLSVPTTGGVVTPLALLLRSPRQLVQESRGTSAWPSWRRQAAPAEHAPDHSDAERAPTERTSHQPNAQRRRWLHVRDHGWHGDVFRCGILASAEMASAGSAQNCVRAVCACNGGRMASVISRWREYLLIFHAARRQVATTYKAAFVGANDRRCCHPTRPAIEVSPPASPRVERHLCLT
jgi:hypothetical protein